MSEEFEEKQNTDTQNTETDSFESGRQAAMEEAASRAVKLSKEEPAAGTVQKTPEENDSFAMGRQAVADEGEQNMGAPVYPSSEPMMQGSSWQESPRSGGTGYGNNSQPYGSVGNNGQPYGGAGNSGQPYGSAGNNGQPYGGAGNNGYQQPNNGMPGHNLYAAPGKSNGIGFGIASLVLGILSIFCFAACINFVMGIIAIILGIVQIVSCKQKGLAIAGIITSAVSILIGIIFWVVMFGATESGALDEYLNDAYYNYYDDDEYDEDDYNYWRDFFDHHDDEGL